MVWMEPRSLEDKALDMLETWCAAEDGRRATIEFRVVFGRVMYWVVLRSGTGKKQTRKHQEDGGPTLLDAIQLVLDKWWEKYGYDNRR